MDRDLSRSRAILIGNSTYRPDSGIPDLPAATSCVPAMAELLTGDLCGWPTERIVRLMNLATPSDLARHLVSAVKDVQDTVLVYYVGHGLRTSQGQLVLALADTDNDPQSLPYTAMTYGAIAMILRGCPAATKLVILDCCHAELATRANYVFQSADDIAEAYPVDGLYFIGASRTLEKAKAPIGGGLTYFTSAFLNIVREGIPGRPSELRLDQIFVEFRGRLLRGNLPEPVESGTRGAHQYPFARNAAGPDRDGYRGRLEQPQDAVTVGSYPQIRGQVAGVPPQHQLWIVVRRAPGGVFWPKWPKVAPDNTGRFTLSIIEGGPPGHLVISLLMVPNARGLEFDLWLQRGDATHHYPPFHPEGADIELASVSVLYDPSAP